MTRTAADHGGHSANTAEPAAHRRQRRKRQLAKGVLSWPRAPCGCLSPLRPSEMKDCRFRHHCRFLFKRTCWQMRSGGKAGHVARPREYPQ